ncbi:hypothetical protein B0H19DRAFT_1373187 [Mycena capillaripes]|nr:hypothetical protein B0H19DRAFT_1373187 [Mycena capillaripes]
MDFVYIDSAEKIEKFSQFVASLKEPKVQVSEWILLCLIKSQSPMSAEGWDNTPATTNTGETQHHWTNSRTGIKLSLVEAIERYVLFPLARCQTQFFFHTARKVAEGVTREIGIALKSGVLVNSRNESAHRTARNATRTSTTMRKSCESRELADERVLLDMEINAEKETRNASAARLKALQAHKSATRKNSSAAKRRGARTVVVGSNSSGRLTLPNSASTPLRSTSNDAEPSSPPAASTSAPDLLTTDLSEASAPPLLSIPEAQANAYSYSIENIQQFSDSAFDFDFSFLAADPGNTGDDIAWLNSLMFDTNMTKLLAPPPLASITFSCPGFSHSRFSVVETVATASKKRKKLEEVDPANMVERTRSRKAPKRFDI